MAVHQPTTSRVYASGGGRRAWAGWQFQSTLTVHDPNPPITLEHDNFTDSLFTGAWRARPFRSLGRNRYLWHYAQDLDAPAGQPEPATYAAHFVRIPFKSLGRSRYLLHQDWDSAPAAPEPDTLAQFLVRIPFKPLGHSGYLLHSAQDLSFVEPFDLPSFLAKPQYKPLGRNPYLWNTAQDFDAPVITPESDTWIPYLVRLNIRGVMRVVPAYVFNLAPQDEDAPPVVTPTGGTYIPTFRTRRGR